MRAGLAPVLTVGPRGLCQVCLVVWLLAVILNVCLLPIVGGVTLASMGDMSFSALAFAVTDSCRSATWASPAVQSS